MAYKMDEMIAFALSTVILGFQGTAAPLNVTSAIAAPSKAQLADWQRWKNQRIESLKAPTGWLSVSALHKISKGYTTLGASKESDLQLRPESVGAKAGTIIRSGGKFTFQAHPSTTTILDGEAVDQVLLSDDASSISRLIQVGEVTLTVIKRGKDHYVRVLDPGNERKKTFPGIPTFPYQSSWRVTGKLVKFAKPKDIPVTNVLGITEPTSHIGMVTFSVGGKSYALTVQDGGDRVSLLFGDRSNQTSTYGSGRFLVSEPIQGDKVILDFNKAYSPPCAFTDFATCPLPIAENKLPISIETGEKRIKGWSGSH